MHRSFYLSLLLVLFLATGCDDAPDGADPGAAGPTSPPVVFTEDGAWCWFQDPRAVYVDGAHTRTYAGWMTHDGRLQVGAYDHDTGQTEVVTLKEDWDVDDHNTNSFLVLPDRRLMAFYTRHNEGGLYGRITTAPEDIGAWEEEVVITDTTRNTYSHPVYLSDEGRAFVFWRGPSWKPTVSVSTDLQTWSPPQVVIEEEGREAGDIRPYLKVATDGVSTIHLAFTDGHPRNEPTNSVYYLKYEGGTFYTADGTAVGDLDALPVQPSRSDRVYDGAAMGVRAWVWDIALDAGGRPVIAYTRLPSETDHRYHYAAWDGSAWVDHEIVPGGPWFPQTPTGEEEREQHYSGGMGLHPGDPAVVYLSRPVDGTFEIEKWVTPDLGQTWTHTAVTSGSGALNVRPVVPRGYTGTADHVLWMNGTYRHYTDYHTALHMVRP